MIDEDGIERVRALARRALAAVGHDSDRSHVERDSLAHGINALTDPGTADDNPGGWPEPHYRRRIYGEASPGGDGCVHPVLGLDVTGIDNLAIYCMRCGKRWCPDSTAGITASQLLREAAAARPWRAT